MRVWKRTVRCDVEEGVCLKLVHVRQRAGNARRILAYDSTCTAPLELDGRCRAPRSSFIDLRTTLLEPICIIELVFWLTMAEKSPAFHAPVLLRKISSELPPVRRWSDSSCPDSLRMNLSNDGDWMRLPGWENAVINIHHLLIPVRIPMSSSEAERYASSTRPSHSFCYFAPDCVMRNPTSADIHYNGGWVFESS
jgi:hypothetical protein